MNNKKEGFAMAKQRDPVLDSMRGIGIVLMVLGHAGFPGSSFIYLFHMALFFMLSGWFFSPHTGESAHRLARFAKRKVVTLWLPFVAANTVYTLLTNLFLKVNILTGDERILDLPGNLITTPVTIKDIIGRTAHWSVFDGGTELGGAMWFIQALFQISLLYAGRRVFVEKTAAQRRYADPARAACRRAALARLAGPAHWLERLGPGHCGQLLLPVLLGCLYCTGCSIPHGPARGALCCAGAFVVLLVLGQFGSVRPGGQQLPRPALPAGGQPGGLDAGV